MRNLWTVAALLPLAGAATLVAAPGADIITGDVTGVSKYGVVNVGGVNWTGYAFGTTSCNIGTPGSAPEPWVASTNQHPLIGQNVGEPPDRDAFADGHQQIKLAVRELNRKKPAVFRAQPRRFGVTPESLGAAQPIGGEFYLFSGPRNENFHICDCSRVKRMAKMYYPLNRPCS